MSTRIVFRSTSKIQQLTTVYHFDNVIQLTFGELKEAYISHKMHRIVSDEISKKLAG